jgi:hypothetical protein
MKKFLLGLCLAVLGVACKASGANMHDTSCTGENCPECTMQAKEDCSDCSADPACTEKCEGEQVCPVTGKSMN